MGKIIRVLLFLSISGSQFPVAAQSLDPSTAVALFQREQAAFLKHLDSVTQDKNIINRLSRFIEKESDSIRLAIMRDNTIQDSVKIKGIYSLVYFMDGLRENLKKQKSEVYDIPGALEYYKQLLKSFLNNRTAFSWPEHLNPRQGLLLSIAFRQFKEKGWLEDMAIYKRLVSTPDHILSFLELNPGFRFVDSLLLFAAAKDPLKLGDYLRRKKTALTPIIRNHHNIYLQQLVQISDRKSHV